MHATLQADGIILAPRTLSRYERFQLARITEWSAAGDPYAYKLSAASLRLASEQGIKPDTIAAFLRRVSGDALPDSLAQSLEQWQQAGTANAWLTQAVILRTSTEDALTAILERPSCGASWARCSAQRPSSSAPVRKRTWQAPYTHTDSGEHR